MSVTVKASIEEVRAAIAADPSIADLLPSLTLHLSESTRPRRSFGLIPGLETVVGIAGDIALGVAGNATWTLLYAKVFPALVRHFGQDKVTKIPSGESKSPMPPSSENLEATKEDDAK
jgi:hypothetical protein